VRAFSALINALFDLLQLLRVNEISRGQVSEFVATTQIHFEALAQVYKKRLLFNGILRAEQQKSHMRREVRGIFLELRILSSYYLVGNP